MRYKFSFMKNLNESSNGKVTIFGIFAGIVLASGPYLYGTINGVGILMYGMIAFVGALIINTLFFKKLILVINKGNAYAIAPLFVMFLWHFVTYVWSPVASTSSMFSFVKKISFCFILPICVYSRRDKNLIRIITTVVALYICYYMLTTATLSVQNRYVLSIMGVEQDPNYVSYFFMLPSVFLLSIILTNRLKIWKIVACIGEILIIITLLFTGSRGGMLGVFTGLLIYAISYKKKSVKKVITFGCIISVIFVCFLNLDNILPAEIAVRFSLSNLLSDGGSGRLDTWKTFLKMCAESPWDFIMGHGNDSSLLITRTTAHNQLIETMFEHGIIGLFLLLWFYYQIAKEFLIRKSWISFSVLGAIFVTSMTLSVVPMMQYWLSIVSIIVTSDCCEDTHT